MKKRPLIHEYLEVYTMFFWLDVVTWIITKGKKKMDECCCGKMTEGYEQADEDTYTFYKADEGGRFHAIEDGIFPMGLAFHDALAAYVQERFSNGLASLFPGRYMVTSANRCSAEVFDVTVPNKFVVTLVRGPVQG